MAIYQYWFYDYSTKRLIDVLPLESVRFSQELSGVGTLSAELPLYSPDLPASRVSDAIHPYRTKIFVERGDQLVWGGWIHEEPAYDSASGRVSISCEETLGYFARRFMPTNRYEQIDQLAIARDLITSLQSEPGGDMWITVDPSLTSGVLRDREYSSFDKTPCLSALMQLSEAIGGFEVGTQTLWDSSHLPQETLLLGYPQLGRRLLASGLVWEYDRFSGGQQTIESWTWGPAGVPMATRCWANSETDEGIQLTAYAERPSLIADGYPLMEHSESYDGISYVSTLQAHAEALQEFRSRPRIAATMTAKAQPGLTLGDFQQGDDVLCRISDWRFPPGPGGEPGFIGWLRIVACEVAPGEDGQETYTFTLGDLSSDA